MASKEKNNSNEFSTLSKRRTGLPVNIFVDDGKYYIQNNSIRVIKFQINYNDFIESEDDLAYMTLDGGVIESTIENKNVEITNEDINKIRNFVRNNKHSLLKLSDMEIDIIDFCNVMIVGGEVVSDEEYEKRQELIRITQEITDSLTEFGPVDEYGIPIVYED